MSINRVKSRNIPAFLKKLYSMLQNPQNTIAISWAPNGIGFYITNEDYLTKTILPQYFKHSNYCSFIRQLNMYDFHKIRKENIENYFHHDMFIYGDIESISQIRRKPEKKKSSKESIDFKNHSKRNRKTQITLNSDRSIKPPSQESIFRRRDVRNEIFYEEIEERSGQNHNSIPIGEAHEGGDSGELHQDSNNSAKMSINNEIQNVGGYEGQRQREILVPSHSNIFHFVSPYQLGNFGIFM